MDRTTVSEQELRTPPSQSDLLAFIEDLERSVEDLSASLNRVRETVQFVALQVREAEGLPASSFDAPPVLTLVDVKAQEPEAAASESPADSGSPAWAPAAGGEEPQIEAAANGAGEAPAEALTAAEPASSEPDAAAEEAAREEVRRAVEATRAQLSWSNLRVDSGFNIGSRDEAPAPVVPEAPPVPVVNEQPAPAAEPAARNQPPAATSPSFVDDVARREEVRLAVERARAEMHKDDKTAADEDERRREEVRRAVESARGSLNWGELKADTGWSQFQPEPGGFSIGPGQAPAHSFEPAEQGAAGEEVPEDLDPEEARRLEVRRAVEAARVEMLGSSEPPPPRIVPIVPKPGAPVPRGADFNGPPVIVIEDPTGRVELSQVFATLSRVDRSSQAALLNYSPHSVTIGLNVLATVPDLDELREAAQAVFGRVCSVTSEAGRTAIQIGGGGKP
jgi:hypothetical protein